MLNTDFDPTAIATDTIPPGLDQMAPGPVLAGFLSAIDVNVVSGYDRVVVLRAHQRMASHYQAHTYNDMTAITNVLAQEGETGEINLAAAEIRAALHLTRRSADIELSFALDLRQRLPQLHAMLESGVIDVQRAKTIDRHTCHLTTATARNVVERIADTAPQASWLPVSRNSALRQTHRRPRNATTEPSTNAGSLQNPPLMAQRTSQVWICHQTVLLPSPLLPSPAVSTRSPDRYEATVRHEPWTNSEQTSSWTSSKEQATPHKTEA
jgi:hypothetical protein